LLLVAGGAIALMWGAGREIVSAYGGGRAESALQIYHSLLGVAVLMGNGLAGLFWVLAGPSAAFGFSAWALGLGLALTVAWLPWLRRGFPD
jgi:hypothetical protein